MIEKGLRLSSPGIVFILFVLFVLSLRIDPVVADIPRIDWLSVPARVFSLIGNGLFLFTIAGILFVLGMVFRDRSLKTTAVDCGVSVAFSGVVVQILKAVFERPRMSHLDGAIPFLLENPSVVDLTGRFNSFPSGHTTVSFAVAYVLSKRYPYLSIPLYSIALMVGLSRIYLGSHYPSDVVAGAIVGVGCVYFLEYHIRVRERWQTTLLFFLAVFISFFKTGSFLLFDVDEAVFSEATREMLHTGDLITPTFNFEPRYDKPILFYWLMYLSFLFFGITEFAARLPSALMGVALVGIVFYLVRRISGFDNALWSAIICMVNLEYFIYTHSAVTDMTLTFFITASMFSFLLSVLERKRMWIILFWCSSALAVLTKGAVGVVFPVGCAIVYLFLTGNMAFLKDLLRPTYIGLFFLISMPWYLLQLYINGWEFFEAFVIKHHIKRYTGVISSHGGPVYYFIPVLVIGFFPWIAFLPEGIVRTLRRIPRDTPQAHLLFFSTIWFLFIFIFFSFSRTKLPNYILPLFPAISILTAHTIRWYIHGEFTSRYSLYGLMVLSALLGVVLSSIPFMGIDMEIRFPDAFFYMLGLIFFIMAVLSFLALKGPVPSITGMVGMTVLLLIFVRTYGLPPVNIYLQKTLYEYATYSGGLERSHILATYELNKPSIAFYSRKKIKRIERSNLDELKELVRKERVIVITRVDRYEDLKDIQDFRIIHTDGRYMLLSN